MNSYSFSEAAPPTFPVFEASRPAVMVAADTEASLLAIHGLLEEMGCDTVLANSGNEALRQLLRRELAVLLLDVSEMDGYEVAQLARLNPATKDVPIIFLTAAGHDEGNMLCGYVRGPVDFLPRPFHPEMLRSKVRVFLELQASRRAVADARAALEHSNKELRALASAKVALVDQLGRANRELEKAQDELKATQAQLVQAAKMASLGELMAGVAHEINNPLAFTVSHLDTVKRIVEQLAPGGEVTADLFPQWERAQHRLGEMGFGLERIRALALKLRTFSRLDEGEWKRISICECIESVLVILGHRLKERIRVETLFGKPDSIDCMPSLLNQAIMNLVANAIDAIEGEGTITISTGAEGDAYVIAVEDDGCGIPDTLRERVLEPFFTTKPAGQGTGLGLSITSAIVKKHGGVLELSRRKEGGTRVSIKLPKNPKAAGQHRREA